MKDLHAFFFFDFKSLIFLSNRYRVEAKGISAEGEILIRIYPPAYWDLLQIRRNKTLTVEESTSVSISRDILEVNLFPLSVLCVNCEIK